MNPGPWGLHDLRGVFGYVLRNRETGAEIEFRRRQDLEFQDSLCRAWRAANGMLQQLNGHSPEWREMERT